MAQFKDSILLIDKVSKPLQIIQQNIRKTAQGANKLQEKFNNLNTKMNKLAPTSKGVLGATFKLTKSFVKLAGASGVLTMGIKQTAAYGDRVDKMSQKIGMGAKAFQEWDYIMSQNGGNVETLQMGFKTLTTQIEGVQKGSKDSIRAFSDLGVSVKDNNGRFRSQDDIFNDVIEKLQRIQNPTKKAMLANRLFGRSATELRPLLNQEAEAIDNLRKKANRLGLILSEEDVKNAVEFTDTMDTLGRFFQARINKALVQILPKLSKIFDDLMAFQKPIELVFTALGKVIELTFGLFNFLGKHWEILVGIGTALGYIAAPAIWTSLVAGATALGAAITSISWPLIGIGAVIGAVVAGVIALWKNWDKVWGWIKETTVSVINSISTWLDNLLEKLGWVAYLIPGLAQIKIGKDVAGAVSKKMNEPKKGGGNVDNSQHNSNNSSVVNNVKNYFAGWGNPKTAQYT